MTEQRIKTYEKILGYILIVAVILGIISSLTGCGEYWEVDSKIVIDYRYTEAHQEAYIVSSGDDKVNTWDFVPEKYELLWEYTYMDGHKERKWEGCTRFEYNNAREELGDIENG